MFNVNKNSNTKAFNAAVKAMNKNVNTPKTALKYDNTKGLFNDRYHYYDSIITSNLSLLFISTGMSGKMQGIHALSTSCVNNERCIARMKNENLVCAYCYASNLINSRDTVNLHMQVNTDFLSTVDLRQYPEVIPLFVSYLDVLRLEWSGDLVNALHAINYLIICIYNPNVRFSLWTKNPDLLDIAIKEVGYKPANLTVILSSSKLNTPDLVLYDFIDKRFTVYTPEYVAAHNIEINCGAKSCRGCMICYSDNDIFDIREVLK